MNNINNSSHDNSRLMSIKEGKNVNVEWIGVTSVLFGILLVANFSNEILRQAVILPDSIT